MPIEGALTSQSSMNPRDGIVSLEQQEQECWTNASIDINNTVLSG